MHEVVIYLRGKLAQQIERDWSEHTTMYPVDDLIGADFRALGEVCDGLLGRVPDRRHGQDGLVFYFGDRDDALLFRLRWS